MSWTKKPYGGEPPGYELGRAARVGKKIGASQMGLIIYELPKGQAVCPYHFEWRTSTTGTVSLRSRYAVRASETVGSTERQASSISDSSETASEKSPTNFRATACAVSSDGSANATRMRPPKTPQTTIVA